MDIHILHFRRYSTIDSEMWEFKWLQNHLFGMGQCPWREFSFDWLWWWICQILATGSHRREIKVRIIVVIEKKMYVWTWILGTVVTAHLILPLGWSLPGLLCLTYLIWQKVLGPMVSLWNGIVKRSEFWLLGIPKWLKSGMPTKRWNWEIGLRVSIVLLLALILTAVVCCKT